MEWLKIDFEGSSDEEDFPDYRWEKISHIPLVVFIERCLLCTEDETLLQFLAWQGFEVSMEGKDFRLIKGWRQRVLTRTQVCQFLVFSIQGVLV